jgi:hypothetical protein
MAQYAIPESLKPCAGRIVDIDSHEMMRAQIGAREFGPVINGDDLFPT